MDWDKFEKVFTLDVDVQIKKRISKADVILSLLSENELAFKGKNSSFVIKIGENWNIELIKKLILDPLEEELGKLKEEIAPINSKKGIEQRDKARDKLLKKAEKEVIYSDDPRLKSKKKEVHKKYPNRIKRRKWGADKKIFSDEIDKFIIKNWEENPDSDLRKLIGEKFDKWYTIDQIKGHRRQINCVSNSPGRKKEVKIKPIPLKSTSELDESIDEMELDE